MLRAARPVCLRAGSRATRPVQISSDYQFLLPVMQTEMHKKVLLIDACINLFESPVIYCNFWIYLQFQRLWELIRIVLSYASSIMCLSTSVYFDYCQSLCEQPWSSNYRINSIVRISLTVYTYASFCVLVACYYCVCTAAIVSCWFYNKDYLLTYIIYQVTVMSSSITVAFR